MKEEADMMDTLFKGNERDYTPIRNTYTDFDGRRADNRVKYCPKCKCCWEMMRKDSGDTFLYYENFVSYGKRKEVCNKCNKKK